VGKLYQFDSSQVGALAAADARAAIDDLEMSTYSLAVGDVAGLGVPQLITGGARGVNWVFELPLPAGSSLADDVDLILFERWYYDSHMVDVDDYDGDGQLDLQVSARCDCGIQNGAGVFLGPLAPGTVYNADVDAAFEITDLDTPLSSGSGAFTRGLVGDLDGDGASELLYGGDRAENLVPTWSFNDYHGNLVLFRGGSLGPHDASDAVAVMYGTCHEGFEGWHVGNVGDVTGDGRPDVVASGTGWGLRGVRPHVRQRRGVRRPDGRAGVRAGRGGRVHHLPRRAALRRAVVGRRPRRPERGRRRRPRPRRPQGRARPHRPGVPLARGPSPRACGPSATPT
jgi:hypothetical protein